MKLFKKYFLFMFFTISFLSPFCPSNCVQALSLELNQMIDQEITKAKAELALNKKSDPAEIERVQVALDTLWAEVKQNEICQREGLDSQWRAPFVILQGLIEKAITQALQKKLIVRAEALFVTPDIPTPLTLSEGERLNELDLALPKSFASFRNPILQGFLDAGGIVNAHHSKETKPNGIGKALYSGYLAKYDRQLKDVPLTIDISKFPLQKTGVLYQLDQELIAIQSRQISQGDSAQKSLWAIKVGKAAHDRKEEIDIFLKNYQSHP